MEEKRKKHQIQEQKKVKDSRKGKNKADTELKKLDWGLQEGSDIICLLAAIRGLWSDLWVIGGDFNVCRFEEEKLNCTRRSRAMMGFSNDIQDLELIDPPLQGAQFTWSRGEAHFQASRIHKFLISPEWSEMFNAIK
ncbi:hypothetical protein MTR67_033649 [Solanum verrucosum]|uniref:Endonuclease/exonuclease/phosphatase domain-containing protein n=1 Tax=Solanum verrucosum TaxID=315347 RepID=A0AAF0ZKI9_SOLVR|nr:hypothetical protein MTR67_033649 [Solanum verrucosum]